MGSPGTPAKQVVMPFPKEPKFYWALGREPALGLAGLNLSSPASGEMPGCSAAGAIIAPISILHPSAQD